MEEQKEMGPNYDLHLADWSEFQFPHRKNGYNNAHIIVLLIPTSVHAHITLVYDSGTLHLSSASGNKTYKRLFGVP